VTADWAATLFSTIEAVGRLGSRFLEVHETQVWVDEIGHALANPMTDAR
jgi:hypothetical protein